MSRFDKHCGRRMFLRGAAGTVIALPLLEYTHGHAFAAGEAPLRFLTVFSHGGTISNQRKNSRETGTGNAQGNDWWRPADPASAELVLGPIHESLEPWRHKLNLVEGIDNRAAIAADKYGWGGHGTANVTALTAAAVDHVPDGDKTKPVGLGPSIDHVVAERLGARQPVRFNRIHLKVRGHQYGSPYHQAARQAVGGEQSPLNAFASIFEGVTSDAGPDPAFLRRQRLRKSILDGVQDGFGAFRGKVSTHDLHAVDAHLEHLRALEQELQNASVPAAQCIVPEGIDLDGKASGDLVGPLHAKVIVAALRCGLTNVANLEISDIVTPWTPTGTPTNSAFGIGHSLGHLARDVGATGPDSGMLDDWLAEMLDNRRWRMSLLAEILAGLDDPAYMEGDRTLLDNSLLLFTSEFREPSKHVSWNVPVLLAGSAGGALPTGRFIDYNVHASDPNTLRHETSESTHNLFTTILHALGENDAHFGDSKTSVHEGPLPGLLA